MKFDIKNMSNEELLKLKYDLEKKQNKFASHLIRLLLEGYELLKYGSLRFPLEYADTILEIKTGKWEREKVIEFSDSLENKMNKALEESKLPSKPRFDAINELTKFILKTFLISENF